MRKAHVPKVLGVGIDVLDVARIRRVVAREGMEFLEEFLLPAEIDRCRRTGYPLPAAAALFAAKEAFFKALGTGRAGKISWHDVEVIGPKRGRGAASLKVTGEVSAKVRKMGATGLHLSLPRPGKNGGVAIASVVLEGGRRRHR